jgi:type IV pilus assembly protein PilA
MVQALKKKLKNEKGFTLIELLAVIVILGIIAAIAIPAIGNVITKSNQKATVQEGVQIINAAKMYVANHPDMTFSAITDSTSTNNTLQKTDLDQYLDHVKSTASYTVIVTKDTNGKISYELGGGHAAIAIANTTSGATTATEQQLTTAANQ